MGKTYRRGDEFEGRRSAAARDYDAQDKRERFEARKAARDAKESERRQ